MFSRTKLATGRAGVASLFLIAGTTLGVGPAHAAAALNCSVNGAVTILDPNEGAGNGLDGDETGTNPTNNVAFSQSSLTCVGSGTWTNVTASGGTTGLLNPAEDCGSGQSNGAWSLKATRGVVDSGSVTWTRVGTVVKLDGSITDGGVVLTIRATLQFTPTPGQVCGPTSAAGSVMTATITGTAVIS
jgi:hypothetical protein